MFCLLPTQTKQRCPIFTRSQPAPKLLGHIKDQMAAKVHQQLFKSRLASSTQFPGIPASEKQNKTLIKILTMILSNKLPGQTTSVQKGRFPTQTLSPSSPEPSTSRVTVIHTISWHCALHQMPSYACKSRVP